MSNKRNRDRERTLIAKKVAEKHNVTPRYVQAILSGDRENEKILADFMELKEGLNDLFENALLTEVKKLVPFN